MLILPNQPKLLMPVPKWQWREPSAAQWKDQFGNPGVQTRFRIIARLHDGHTKCRLWFDDRDDFDAFLLSLADYLANGIPIPCEDWGLVNEVWGDPDLHRSFFYAVDTVVFLSTTGSNQSYPEPVDWNASDNSIEGLGAAASGSVARNSSAKHAAGSGAGEYAKIVNFAFTGGTATYRIGAGGAGIITNSNGAINGNPGEVTYFNASSDPGTGTDNTKLGAKPGLGGQASIVNAVVNGGAGGTGGWGSTKFPGGRGGNATGAGTGSGNTQACGSGGAAGPGGAGGNGVDTAVQTAMGTDGGSANNGATVGGTGSGTGSTNPGNISGNDGTEWDATHGCGSGGGGGAIEGGEPGNYGGASGAARATINTTGTYDGGQGLIVVTYEPVAGGQPSARRGGGIPGMNRTSGRFGGGAW